MSVKSELFGFHNEKDVFLYSLDNSCGLSAEITNYGGIVKSLKFNDVDIVLGRDSLYDYLNNTGNFGAIIGRNTNRIENAQFSIGESVYKLSQNVGKHNIHGGVEGFAKKLWEAEAIEGEQPSLVLKRESPDGEEGFPGNASIRITYTLTKENSFKISYEAICDKDTVINLTNHSYFNLNGHNSGTINGHSLWLNSDFYTPINSEFMPYGEIRSTKGTAIDFSCEKSLSQALMSDHEQIKLSCGLDNNFALYGNGFRHIATLKGDITAIQMQVFSDLPAIQVYTGNKIEVSRRYKEGACYTAHAGICLETQFFPNSLKYPFYPNPILKKGQKYNTVTEYKFK